MTDRDTETSVLCPKCSGKGFRLTEELDRTHRKRGCDLCGGTGVVSVSAMRAWKSVRGGRPT